MAPAVTIGLPVYNGMRYIEGALTSLLGQTFTDLELLVADNCSTDGTIELVERFAESDRRVRLLRSDANRGLSWNWNRLVVAAAAPRFRWACYDDRVQPTLLEHLVGVLDGAPPDVVGCFPDAVEIDVDDAPRGVYDDRVDLRELAAHRRLAHLLRDLRRCNAMFSLWRTDVLRTTRLLGRYGHPDHVLLAELALRGRIWRTDQPLFLRRIHPENSITAHRTFAQLARLHDPTLKQRRFYPHSRLFVEHLVAIAQAPLSAGEAARCTAVLVTRWPLYRAMAGEVRLNLRETLTARRARATRQDGAAADESSPADTRVAAPRAAGR